MAAATGPDLVCFGYLAHAQVTAVRAYPAANSGAEVVQVFPSLAGDAPITALTARRLGATVYLVTLGRLGAIGYTAAGIFGIPAPQVPVRHTHGAGAAFSGGLAHAYLTGATVRQAIQAGCMAGTAHCAATGPVPYQRTDSDRILEVSS